MARGRGPLHGERRHVPNGLPLPAHAPHVHGGPAGGPLPHCRHPLGNPAHSSRLPMGPLPQEPRRTDARDGHRRGARLHVPGLRTGSPGPGQRRHPSEAGAAVGQRPPADRDDERAPAVHAGHAHRLLRRRNRNGGQHLPRRPQRGPDSHAMERRPQRRLLGGQPPAAVPARHHRPGVPLTGGQRRGAGPQPQFAPVVDEAPDRAPPALQGIRPRLTRNAVPREPEDLRVHPTVRR